jgi:hypothetical protein
LPPTDAPATFLGWRHECVPVAAAAAAAANLCPAETPLDGWHWMALSPPFEHMCVSEGPYNGVLAVAVRGGTGCGRDSRGPEAESVATAAAFPSWGITDETTATVLGATRLTSLGITLEDALFGPYEPVYDVDTCVRSDVGVVYVRQTMPQRSVPAGALR